MCMGLPSADTAALNPRRPAAICAILAAVACTMALAATSPGLPMAWDEGNAIWRADGIRRWAGRWLTVDQDAAQPGPMTAEAIDRDWPYTTKLEGHPAFYGIVIALGTWASGGWLQPSDAARLGPMMLFGLAAGAMFYRLWRQYSTVAAVAAVTALLLMPRMFAHAHFASFDGPLVSCWILAWATFTPGRGGWPRAILWGIALGLTFSTKATGWLAPIPFIAYALLYRDRRAAETLAIGIPVALVMFWVLNPPLWHHPLEGTAEFFRLNLNRGDQPGMNISSWFLGRMYNLDHPLPWYNTLFWTAVTVPVGLLLLSAVGLASIFRRRVPDAAAVLLAANWLVLLIVRAIPGTPPHDGVRLFLPSFAFLAALTGVGAAWALGCLPTRSNRPGKSGTGAEPPDSCAPPTAKPEDSTRRRLIAAFAVVLIYAGSATSFVWYHPQWLSYYNLLIGGLNGAAARGMEPTYYWDALDCSVLDWLDRNTGPGEKVLFAAASGENLEWMRRWGTLPVEFRAEAPGTYRWYVIQHRPSGWQPEDRRLIEDFRPAFRKTIRPGGRGPWRLDVPLVEVYAYQQHEKAKQALGTSGSQ